MAQRKTAARHPRRDGDMLRSEKVSLLRTQIKDGTYQTQGKFSKIIDTFIKEFIR